MEKQTCIGGVCIETGSIPSKTFREAVRRLYSDHATDGGGAASLRPSRPTMEQLIAHVDHVVAKESDVVQDALSRNDVEVINGSASFEGPHKVLVEGVGARCHLTAENILISVGTRPAAPRGIEADGKVVVTSDSLLQLEKLPRKVAVVGAGVIAIEYASMFAALGVQVTIIDKRPRPLEFLDHEIVADLILFSVGRVGATDTLNLEAAGLKADERGRLKVNDDYQTKVPHIYAAGDVIGYPALAATSSEQGRLAACHMFNLTGKPMGDHFPIGIYAIPEISMVGKTEEDLTAAKVLYETGIARFREIARGQILGDDSGMFKMIFNRDDGRLLGVHCIGSGATELVHVGQAVIGLGGGLDYFLDTVFNYPTLADCYKVAAYNASNKINYVKRIKARKKAGAD